MKTPPFHITKLLFTIVSFSERQFYKQIKVYCITSFFVTLRGHLTHNYSKLE